MKTVYFLFTLFTFFTCSQNEAINTSPNKPETFEDKLSDAAIAIIDANVQYDPTYYPIKYPNGDVPKNKGVCTDIVIRAYRKLGIDLQKEVHEDMLKNFASYPNAKKWGLHTTDTNIDHRRVPNLEVFFARKGKTLPISETPKDYKTGELVTWMINGKYPHIGIVTNKKSPDGKRLMIVHNVGNGQVLEDCLFDWKIVGHFKYSG